MLGHSRNGSWVEIAVRDSGPGIDESEIPRIFSPFFTTKEKGTGLGLAIATNIIEAHRGQITAFNSPKEEPCSPSLSPSKSERAQVVS